MCYARRVLAVFVYLTVFLAFPTFALNLHPIVQSSGLIGATKSIHTEAAGIFFSGSFGYSIGGGQAVMKADTVTNPNGTASGPLRFSLWFTSAPFPSTGFTTASYDITPSLAAGQSVNGVNAGNTGVPFTNPPTGCYYVSLVLEENVSGTWTERDYGTFSRTFDIGNGCITSFTATPSTIPPGSSSSLSWTTTGASVTSVVIDNGVGSKAASGSASVSPTSTTTYTLSAFTTANASPPTAQVTVTIGAVAPTATFSASPITINLGQSSTLTWTTTNATTVSIDNGVGSKPVNGNTSVSPTSTTTYTLTVNGPGGTITKTATVTVTQPAPTVSFSASPNTIGVGGTSSLIWNTTNATIVTIDNGVGSQPVSGTTSVHPTSTTTYTLTANGPGGTMTGQTTVTVSSGPSITFFASPVFISAGQTSTLNWSTTNATSVTIDNGVGARPVNGTAAVTPGTTTTYTLTAIGPGGTSTATATVAIVALPTVTFSADTTTIAPGGSATLSWSTTGADTVTIDQGIGVTTAVGTRTVHPTQTTIYHLTATNAAGSTDASVTVTVSSPVPPKHRAVKH
jgi:hypothetical protein